MYLLYTIAAQFFNYILTLDIINLMLISLKLFRMSRDQEEDL